MLMLSLHCPAQNISNDYQKQAVDAAVLRQKHNYEMEMYQRYTGYKYKPYVGLNVAFPRFYGDVMPSKNAVTDLGTLWGINASVAMDEEEHFLLNIYSLFGSLNSYHQDFSSAVDNFSFSTRMAQLDVSFTYQYKELFGMFRPYVRAGVGVVRFNVMGDLRDASGKYYLYPYPAAHAERFPSFDMSEYVSQKSSDKHINYDKVYETDLRRRNLYGDGDYARVSPVIPLELGLNIPIGNFLCVRVAYWFTYTFTDMLDNVSGKTAKEAQKVYPHEATRNELNANYLHYYDDGVTPPQKRAAALSAGTFNDMYGGLQISLQIRPFTSTRKIHNKVYTGSELNSTEAAVYQRVVLEDEADAPKSRFTPAKEPVAEVTYTKKRIPRKFKSVDSNGDGIISSIEMNNAIEQYLEGGSTLKRKDIVKLQEFYRSQRRVE